MKSETIIVPRNGQTLVVGVGCHISGCVGQKEVSLESQGDISKETIAELYDGPIEFRIIAPTGKGERLDRLELYEFEAAYRSGEYDIFVSAFGKRVGSLLTFRISCQAGC